MKAEAQASEAGLSHARMRGSRALRIRSERILKELRELNFENNDDERNQRNDEDREININLFIALVIVRLRQRTR